MNTLTQRVIEYIAESAAKKAPSASASADVRAAHAAKYAPAAWLEQASLDVERFGMKLVTHAAKFIHGDSRVSNIFDRQQAPAPFPVFSTLGHEGLLDIVGNAAGMAAARVLNVADDAGRTLIKSLYEGDTSALAPLATSEEQLARWVSGFLTVLDNSNLASHKYGKEVYFPVDGDYHVLAPLFPASLYHAMHNTVNEMRFPEGFRDANIARANGKFHPLPIIRFLRIGGFEVCAANPQTRSYLNSKRGGLVNLLPCIPPVWKTEIKKLESHDDVFRFRAFSRLVREETLELRGFLLGTGDYNNVHIRHGVIRRVNHIVDVLISYIATIYSPEWATDWAEDVAASFGRWLARSLRGKNSELNMQKAEANFFTRICLPELVALQEVMA
ncbi:type I-F CRISPR-associated protein Csy1 [Salmonella enterica subsp. enterica serovar Nigeria]|nr:type I-F CRISPR-associated protein Csy1 [Salmonella enterica subsp. enterica serovar Nigeria]